MTMCLRAVPNRNKVLIDTQLHPQTKNVLITRAKPLEIHIEESSITNEDLSEEFACQSGYLHNDRRLDAAADRERRHDCRIRFGARAAFQQNTAE